ncbi:hypothetical protein GNY06_00670 [Elizabethkingia argentiflava]|uniref:Uncharacterized protein n=1 Tax=Elizabethkingia argenteiflava TaxID=2681556 RepID=A0A845PUM0_9FLAO|nr:hypothetical protein [Elizabethkingia argenteiflava]NAW49968.1 hypothetical protein [Elizabethkingia argenteiflava]
MKKNNYFNNFRIYASVLFFPLFLLFIVVSCSRDNVTEEAITQTSAELQNGPELNTFGDLVLQKNVIVLNDESLATISEKDSDKITFSHATDQTAHIKEGSVLVGTKLNGEIMTNILAKVVSVVRSNGKIILHTQKAKLEEVIFSGTISGVYDLATEPIQVDGKMVNYIPVEGLVSKDVFRRIRTITANKLMKKQALQGVVNLPSVNIDNTFYIPIELGPIIKESKVNLKVEISPKIKYNLSFSFGQLRTFYIDFILDNLVLQSSVDVQGQFKENVHLSDYVKLDSPIVIGSTGLTFLPNIAFGPYIEVEATDKVKADLFDIVATPTLHLGIPPSLKTNFTNKNVLNIEALGGRFSGDIGVEFKGGIGLEFLGAKTANTLFKGKVYVTSLLEAGLAPEKFIHVKLTGGAESDGSITFGVPPFNVKRDFSLFNKNISIIDISLPRQNNR